MRSKRQSHFLATQPSEGGMRHFCMCRAMIVGFCYALTVSTMFGCSGPASKQSIQLPVVGLTVVKSETPEVLGKEMDTLQEFHYEDLNVSYVDCVAAVQADLGPENVQVRSGKMATVFELRNPPVGFSNVTVVVGGGGAAGDDFSKSSILIVQRR